MIISSNTNEKSTAAVLSNNNKFGKSSKSTG